VDYGEWVNWTENKNWVMGIKAPPVPAAEPASPVTQAREHTGLLRDAMDLAKELKGPDNGNQVAEILRDELKEVRADLREARNQPKQEGGSAFEKMLVEELREERRANRELQMKMLEMNSRPPEPVQPRSDIDSLLENGDKLSKLAETFGFKRGRSGGNADPQASKEDLLMTLGTKALETLGPSINMATAFFFRSKEHDRQQQQNGAVHMNPDQQPQGQIVNATATPAAVTTSDPQANRYQMIVDFLKTNEKLVRKLAPMLLDKYTAGETGYDFRDWFLDRFGVTTWNEFRSKLGPEGMADAISMDSYFEEMQPRDKVIKWFVEVFTDPKDDPEEDDDNPQTASSNGAVSSGVMS
jgi:hypothetical protein